jgi:hypothetical protein
MTTPDGPPGADIIGRLLALLPVFADQLPAITLEVLRELLEANEPGVAVEILSEVLAEEDARIAPPAFAALEEAASELDLAPSVVDQLRPLVSADDGVTEVAVRSHSETVIYVRLIGEAVDVWRPVRAERLAPNVYCILRQPYDREAESWQYVPGDHVVCDFISTSQGPALAAISRAPRSG